VRRSPIFRNSDERLRALEREAIAHGDLVLWKRVLAEARRTGQDSDPRWLDQIVAAAPSEADWSEILALVPAETFLLPLRDAVVWETVIAAMGGTPHVPEWAEQPIQATLETLPEDDRRYSYTLLRAANEIRAERQALALAAVGPLVELARASDWQGAFGGFRALGNYQEDPGDNDDFRADQLRDVPGRYPLPQDFWIPPKLVSGDYIQGSSRSRANRQVFLARWGETPGVHDVHGGYGLSCVALRLRPDYPEELLADLRAAENYEDIDDDDAARLELEQNEKDEAWKTWIDFDWKRTLMGTYPELSEKIDELDENDKKLHDLFDKAIETKERSEDAYEFGPQGAEINLESLISELTEKDVFSAFGVKAPRGAAKRTRTGKRG